MVFSSIIFLFYFLPITALLVIVAGKTGGKNRIPLQNMLLLIMSLLFYAWGEPIYVLLMMGSILLNFLFGKLIGASEEPKKRKQLLIASVILNLLALGVFKYAGMVASFLNQLIPFQEYLIPVPKIRLPIGISFFTFQAMSYVIDVYRKEVPAQKKLTNLALYISFFPQLIAGPIVRYHDINQQLENRSTNMQKIYSGLVRFIIGLAKKVLIANVVAEAADKIFALGANDLTTPLAWLGVICYTLQIYFDFSGYSDMAIGLGRIFGFKFLENFNYPYTAKGIRDFWRRWHISLSTWFRDYLYIPLGGNRKGELRTYINQIIVFFLCGLWHGASWTFVAWGLYHGLFLCLEKLFLGKKLEKIPSPIIYLYTLLVVMVGWVLFRSESFSDSLVYLKAMFGLSPVHNPLIGYYLENHKLIFILAIGLVASTPFLKNVVDKFEKCHFQTRPIQWVIKNCYNGAVFLVILLILLWIIGSLAANTYNPFIYFRF